MHSSRTSFSLILLLWAAGLGAAGQFAKMSVPFTDLQMAYPQAGVALGFLVSLISFLGIVLGLVAGLFVSRVGSRRLILPALLLGAVISLGQSFLPPLPILLASRVVEGLSHLVIVVVAPTLIAQAASDRHRAAAMTLWSSFFGVSFALVAWLGLPLVARAGIGSLFQAHAAWMLLVAGALAWRLPPDVRPTTPPPAFGGLSGILHQHLRIYRSAYESAPAWGWLFYTLTYVALLTVLPSTLPPEVRGSVSGAMPLAGIVVSMTLGVLLLRRFPAVSVIIAGFVVSGVAVVCLAMFPGQHWLYVAPIAALGLVQGASFTAIPQLNQTPEALGNANGAVAQMGNLGNTCGTPLLLVVMGAFGYPGLIGFALLAYGCGIGVHLHLARRRARTA